MADRESIIKSMCITWRHDFGLVKEEKTHSFDSGMTEVEQRSLLAQMGQLFDHHVAPLIAERDRLLSLHEDAELREALIGMGWTPPNGQENVRTLADQAATCCGDPGDCARPCAERRAAKFQLGDRVRKTKGSQWHGTVVGTYSTELTPEGYAVESATEKGSVQIYPAAALEAWEDQA